VKRITILLVTLFALLLLPIYIASASSSFPSIPEAYAYGNYATTITSTNKTIIGPTAPVGSDCKPTPTTLTNSTGISLGSLGGSGNVQTMITISDTATSATVVASSDVENLTILNGSIRSARIHVAVSSTATAAGATSSNNTTFSGLSIAGQSISDTPAPDTRKELPGLGFVILNEQIGPVNGPDATSISVNAIDVHLTVGPFAGTNIVIGHANSSETRTAQPVVVNANAFGLYANGLAGPGSASYGPVSPVRIACTGGSDQNSTNGFTSPVLGKSGTVNSSAFGEITSSGATATSQSTISNLELLSFLITADKVTVIANANWNGIEGFRSGSMRLLNGKAGGKVLPSSPLPNQRIDLPGIGFVIVNEQFGSSNSSGAVENVIAFDIHVTQSNSAGLPINARIIVCSASASAFSY
jgi:hypothetical protein